MFNFGYTVDTTENIGALGEMLVAKGRGGWSGIFPSLGPQDAIGFEASLEERD